MSGFNRLLKNSISNIINGFSNIILGIVLSPFLLKILSLDDFSIWNLALQIGAFFSLISYACQMTVARYITSAIKKRNKGLKDNVIHKGLILSFYSMIFCFIVIFILFLNFNHIFSQIKPELYLTARYSVALISISFVIGFIGSVFSGYFTGIERNDIPAIINLMSRILLGLVVILVANYGIISMSLAYLIVNILSYFIMYIIYNRNKSNSSDKNEYIFIDNRKFFHYFIGMCGINLSSFLLIGMNGILVGKYAFSEYSYYSLSMVLVMASVGFINAALMPTMQPMIRCYDDEKKINDLLLNLTFFVLLVIFIVIVIVMYISPFILKLWVGDDIANKMFLIFMSLLTVNLVRLIGLPLSLFYLAKAKQNEIIYLPFFEGIISIGITLLLINKTGMYAVPLGLVIAVVVIFIIYSFRLVNILNEKYRIFYRIIFIIYPIMVIGYVFLNIKFLSHNYIGSLILIPIFIFSFFKIKTLKKLLGD
ncbi:TPA: oligosaccharide flippase family protein [Photobacterium damselae]